MSHQRSICKALRRRPITLVSTTYDANGQLHQNVIFGPTPALYSLPEEGLYLLYCNRGLQIASAPCDRRKCNITQICYCAEHQHVNRHTKTSATSAERQQVKYLRNIRCHDCILAWLYLYDAAEQIRLLRLCFLNHPRTLTWSNLLGNVAFHYDSELEGYYASTRTYGYPASVKSRTVKECPPGLMGFLQDIWEEFLDRRTYSYQPVMSFSDAADTNDGEGKSNNNLMNSMSEWDDVDVPIGVAPPLGSHTLEDEQEFDMINDLIDEEFPKLKAELPRLQYHESEEHRPCKSMRRNRARTDRVSSKCMSTHEGRPAPVIIPPKNMVVGLGLWSPFRAHGLGRNESQKRIESHRKRANMRLVSRWW
ncbi:hypothetical protein F5Y19DRAFT_133820 [Xylariaceae sp. FL1651]|nr:hypothetical protein F5Y19DRAFT_133820 [Xylariaceae sp. FL1651]